MPSSNHESSIRKVACVRKGPTSEKMFYYLPQTAYKLYFFNASVTFLHLSTEHRRGFKENTTKLHSQYKSYLKHTEYLGSNAALATQAVSFKTCHKFYFENYLRPFVVMQTKSPGKNSERLLF
jgi:hypothetical protein